MKIKNVCGLLFLTVTVLLVGMNEVLVAQHDTQDSESSVEREGSSPVEDPEEEISEEPEESHVACPKLKKEIEERLEEIKENGKSISRQINRAFLLHDAAQAGCIDLVKELVDLGANVNYRKGEEKKSPLFFAVGNGHFHVAEFLLEHKANPNYGGVRRQTPLMVAIRRNDKAMVALLLKHKADIDLGVDGYTPLFYAIESGNHDLCQYLLENNATVFSNSDKFSYLSLAIVRLGLAGLDSIKALIERGARLTDREIAIFQELFVRARKIKDAHFCADITDFREKLIELHELELDSDKETSDSEEDSQHETEMIDSDEDTWSAQLEVRQTRALALVKRLYDFSPSQRKDLFAQWAEVQDPEEIGIIMSALNAIHVECMTISEYDNKGGGEAMIGEVESLINEHINPSLFQQLKNKSTLLLSSTGALALGLLGAYLTYGCYQKKNHVKIT